MKKENPWYDIMRQEPYKDIFEFFFSGTILLLGIFPQDESLQENYISFENGYQL